MKHFGLLARLLTGILLGVLIGSLGGVAGIGETALFHGVIRAFATFNSLF